MSELSDLVATPQVSSEVRRFVRLIASLERGHAAMLADQLAAIASGAPYKPAPTRPPRNWSLARYVTEQVRAPGPFAVVLGRVSGDDFFLR